MSADKPSKKRASEERPQRVGSTPPSGVRPEAPHKRIDREEYEADWEQRRKNRRPFN